MADINIASYANNKTLYVSANNLDGVIENFEW